MAALISQTDLEAHKVCLQGPLVDALLTSTPLHLPLPPHPKKMALQKEKRVKVYQSNLKLFISRQIPYKVNIQIWAKKK